MDARGDLPNDMATNGELFLQCCVVASWLRHSDSGSRFVAFDVGANRGDWVEHLLAQFRRNVVNADVMVVAFEPDPVAAVHLKERFAHESRITFEQIALSSSSGIAEFHISGPGSGTNSLHAPDKRHGDDMDVPTDTLDGYCKRHDIHRIDLVKCDTEGNDCEVIRAALGNARV
jgi:FkbM family methyltransferase